MDHSHRFGRGGRSHVGCRQAGRKQERLTQRLAPAEPNGDALVGSCGLKIAVAGRSRFGGYAFSRSSRTMNTIGTYLFGLGLTLLAAGAVVVCLRRSLRRILVDLCGTEARGDFWTAFSVVLLILGIFLCVFIFARPSTR